MKICLIMSEAKSTFPLNRLGIRSPLILSRTCLASLKAPRLLACFDRVYSTANLDIPELHKQYELILFVQGGGGVIIDHPLSVFYSHFNYVRARDLKFYNF